MKILWFPRLQFDVDRLHRVTWVEMARELGKQGHCVRVAVAGLPRDEAGPNWIRLPLVRIKGLRLLWFWLAGSVAFAWQYLTFRPDLVLLDVYTAGFGFPLALMPRRARFVLDNRTPISHTSRRGGSARRWLENALTSFAYAFARRWFDGMTTITETYRRSIAERFRFPLSRIGVWGSGVDPERFDAARYAEPPRPVDLQGRFVILQHGELSLNRGILEMVRALREPGMDSVTLVLLGDGPARPEAARVARELGVEDRIRFLPPAAHADVPAIVAWCDCAVLAYPVDDYWNCNHPIKFVEYLAMGKVVVCTPIAVVREAGAQPRFLEVIPDGRPESIAEGIRRCMRDPDLRERGRAGIAYARDHHTWRAQAERLMAFVGGIQKVRHGS